MSGGWHPSWPKRLTMGGVQGLCCWLPSGRMGTKTALDGWSLACQGALFLMAFGHAPLAAQLPSWTQVSGSGPARYLHAMVFDEGRGRAVLFGGYDSSSYQGDTWEWDGGGWLSRALASGPSARGAHAMAYDEHRGRVVLFGGGCGYSCYLGDTWEFDGSSWIQVSNTGPAARVQAAMAFDSLRRRVVLFGGGGPSSGAFFFGDTWEWDGQSWVPRLVAASPPPTLDHRMAYDSARGQTVLFGGSGQGGYRADTWEWDGSNWTQVATTGPSARSAYALTYDAGRAVTVLFGGRNQGVLGETWEWDGVAWVLASGFDPSNRYDGAAVYDTLRSEIVLFGGTSGAVYGDTWERGSGMVMGTSVPFGASCGATPLSLVPTPAARPVVGATAQVTLTSIPASLAFMEIGWSNVALGSFALPVSLAAYGLPGCYLLQSAESGALSVQVSGSGVATFSLPLPGWSGLIGLHLYLQAWAPAPGQNAAATILSNGIDWRIGDT